jgi:undecaprenyl-diphosphatase
LPQSPPSAPPRLDDAQTAAVFGLRAALAGAILAGLAVPFGLLVLLVRGRWAPLWRLDEGAVDSLHRFAVDHPLFVLAMKAISRLGSASVYWLLGAVLVGWLLTTGHRRQGLFPALFVVVALAGGGGLNVGVKALVHRVRPALPDAVAHVGGLSFPSGHAQSAVVGYGVLFLIVGPALPRRGRQILAAGSVLAVLTIGFSRVALGVHYPSDVLGGYLLGAAWLLAVLLAFGSTLAPARRSRVLDT